MWLQKKLRLHRPLNKSQKLYKRRLYKKRTYYNFFDLEKAYDTTWKFGIIKDLYDLKLRGRLPKFLKNFLTDRTFQVCIGLALYDLKN